MLSNMALTGKHPALPPAYTESLKPMKAYLSGFYEPTRKGLGRVLSSKGRMGYTAELASVVSGFTFN